MFRHLAVVALSKSKKTYYATKRTVVNNRIVYKDIPKWPILLLKAFQNPFLNLLIVFIYFLFVSGVFTVVFIIAQYTGPSKNGCYDANLALSIIQTTLVVILIGFWFLALIIDFFMTIPEVISCKDKKCKCDCMNIFWLFIKKDPLSYRFEMYILGPLMVLFFLITSILIFAINLEESRGTFITIYSLVSHALFFYQVLFIVFATITSFFRRKLSIKKLRADEEIDAILNDKEPRGGYQLVNIEILSFLTINFEQFSEFAADEYSIENIAIWDDISAYKKETDIEKRKPLGIHIYGTYLDGANSPLEVNVSSKTRTGARKSLSSDMFSDTAFDDILQEIRVNMVDTYSRFQITPQYLQYLSKIRFKKEMGIELK